MEYKKVSVILPCYNYGAFVAETIESALNLDYPNFEIIVVNDGSTDNTKEVLDALPPNEKLKIFHIPNNGVANARNVAVKNASGYYIIPLDADDIILPHFIKETISVMEKDPSIDVVYGDYENFGDLTGIAKARPMNIGQFLAINFLPNTMLIKKEMYEKVGGSMVDKNLVAYIDWQLYINFLAHGAKFQYHPVVMHRYRVKDFGVLRDASKQIKKITTLRKILYPFQVKALNKSLEKNYINKDEYKPILAEIQRYLFYYQVNFGDFGYGFSIGLKMVGNQPSRVYTLVKSTIAAILRRLKGGK